MVQVLVRWPREREGVPFDTAAFNRVVLFLQGHLAAPFRLVQNSGSFALIWDPETDLFTFGASIRINATTTLDNTIWLDGYEADHTTSVHLVRVNSSDRIEFGDGTTPVLFLAPLANDTYLNGRNAADNANLHLLKVNSSNVIEVGESAVLMTLASPLLNNTNLAGRNAANNATVTLIKLNTSDIIETGQTGTQHNLLGTVVAPAIDPPTVDGQVTNESQCKGFYSGYVSGGAIGDGYKYNVSSVTYNGVGNYTVFWDRDFASAFYPVLVTVETTSTLVARVNGKTAGAVNILIETTAGVDTDPAAFHVSAFGTLS